MCLFNKLWKKHHQGKLNRERRKLQEKLKDEADLTNDPQEKAERWKTIRDLESKIETEGPPSDEEGARAEPGPVDEPDNSPVDEPDNNLCQNGGGSRGKLDLHVVEYQEDKDSKILDSKA